MVDGVGVEGGGEGLAGGWDGELAINGFGPGTLVGPTDWAQTAWLDKEIAAMLVIKTRVSVVDMGNPAIL